MAVASSDPVQRWAAQAKAAEQATGIPADVLLGLISVESAGIEGRTSSANAGGLTQFIPGTAARYGVNVAPGHAMSQIMGAARYLVDLGFKSNPTRALNAYNGAQTINGRTNPYAGNVLRAARRYDGIGGTPIPATADASTASTSTSSSGGGGGSWADRMFAAVPKVLLIIALFGGGLALAYTGLRDVTGAGGA
jgi:membrane-bound lytic murein transglycosylase B